jgi:FADH2-dependent halogenase
MTSSSPVVIVGGGPGGAATAIFLADAGIGSVIIERAAFPRFSIGEALTGSAGKLLRRMGLGDALMEQRHPVKNGATVFGANGRTAFQVPAVDLLDDGVRRPTESWQVRRADFDKLLLDTAVARGAQLVSSRARDVIRDASGAVTGVVIEDTENGTGAVIEASMVVDASGMQCFLHNLSVTGAKERGRYDAQVAVFCHLEGTDRNPGAVLAPAQVNNTVLFYAARHHWAWFIPVDDDVVSIGIVVPTATFRSEGATPAAFFEKQLQELNPALAARVTNAAAVRPVEIVRNFSYRIREFVGPGWACVGDSHRFIDPFFAFGVHFALFEGRMAADAIADYLEQRDVAALLDFQRRADAAQDVVQDLIDAFWNQPLAFGYLIDRKHRDDLIDIFAGRIYDIDTPSPGLLALRQINAHAAAE